MRKGGKPLPYEHALVIREQLLEIYISGGRRKFSEYLGINECGAGHLLKYLGFYSDEIQKKLRNREIEDLKKPRCINPFRPFTDMSTYILGFIVGDGCITSRGDNRVLNDVLDISCNDKQIIREIGKAFGIDECKIYEGRYKEGYKSTYSLFVDDFETIGDIKNFGIVPRKSTYGCRIDIDKRFYNHFVRGIFDSDGCVMFANTNPNKVRLRVEICGHRSYLEDIVNNTDIRWKCKFVDGLSFIGIYDQKEIKKFFEYIYKDAGIKLERKWCRFYECFVNGRRDEQYRIYRV